MKKVFNCILACIMFILTGLQSSTLASSVYKDVPATHPHYQAILQLKEAGIMSGYDENHFGPDLPLRRAELLKIALADSLAEIRTTQPVVNPYSDVPSDHTLLSFILYAYQNGIAMGYPDKTFKPDAFASNAEAVKMLIQANKIPHYALSDSTFGLPENSDLIQYIQAAKDNDFLYDPDHFSSRLPMTRGYAAEMVTRIRTAVSKSPDLQICNTFPKIPLNAYNRNKVLDAYIFCTSALVQYKNEPDGKWTQVDTDGKPMYYFEEIERTSFSIELVDTSRAVTISIPINNLYDN